MPPTNVLSPTHHVRSVEPLDTDALLQASRRVDWRFLLPNPELAQVAVVGAAPQTLVESLTHFSSSLTCFAHRAEWRDAQSDFDVVVAGDLGDAALAFASRLLRSDGHLYVEVKRPDVLKRTRYWTKSLERLGFQDVRAHWHLPNFEHCTEMIPLDQPSAIIQCLSRRGSGLKGTAMRVLAPSLASARLIEFLVPCFSILARI